MRKTIALAIIAVFLFSLIPLAFADEDNANASTGIMAKEVARTNDETSPQTSNTKAETGNSVGVKARIEAVKQEVKQLRESSKEKLKSLKEEQKAKIEELKDQEKIDRISNLSEDRLQKIAELDKEQIERLAKLDIKNLDKIAELKKERLDRISNLNEEKIKRLAELDKDKLEKVADLNETEMSKLAAFGRAGLKDIVKEDIEKLKEDLKGIKIMKVRKAEDLDERKISDAELSKINDKFEKAKDDFERAKDELESSKKELSDAIKGKDEQKTINSSKSYLMKLDDILANHLEKIKAKVQESKNIPADSVASIVADIDAEIAKVASIKPEIEAAATKEQVKDAAKKIREEWNKISQLAKLYSERVVSARVEGIINQGSVLEKRLDSILAKAKEKNVTVDVSAEVNSFSEKIAASKDSYTQAQAKLAEAIGLRVKGEPADSDKIKQLAKDADDLLKQARSSLKEAHDVLNTIVKKIKGAVPDAKLSEETEVEVAEETHAQNANETGQASA